MGCARCDWPLVMLVCREVCEGCLEIEAECYCGDPLADPDGADPVELSFWPYDPERGGGG